MKNRKNMNRIGKFWSISIAVASLLYFGSFSSVNAQDDMDYSNEKTNEVQEGNVDYHNLDYRYQNNKEFGKEDKLIEGNDMNDRHNNAKARNESNINTQGADSKLTDENTHGYTGYNEDQKRKEGAGLDNKETYSEDGNGSKAYSEDEGYREKKHEGVQDGIYQNSDPYRSDSKPVGEMIGEKGNTTENIYNSDSIDHDSIKHSYGLNQEIINGEPDQNELKNNEKNYKDYQDALIGIATYQVKYPDMVFDYEYDNEGQLTGVTVSGIDKGEDMDKASEWLIQAYQLSDSLKYRKDKNGVYYNVDERARFKDGKQELYQKLRGNLSYPDDAEERGIEGVVQLKFVVDRFGNVHNVEAEENIDAADWIVDQMVQEAKNSFKRINQDWIPGEIHNIEVPQWVTIPVQFSIKLPPSLQML